MAAFDLINGRSYVPVPPSSRAERRRNLGLLYFATAAVAIAATIVTLKIMPGPGSRLLDSTQLTFSSDPKEGPIFTDGSRIYLASHGVLSQMAATGGPLVPLHIFDSGVLLQDILPDGSKALGLRPAMDDNLGRGTLWTTSILSGGARKVTDHLAQTGQWLPDGHEIVFADGNTIFKIEEDGRDLSRVWEASDFINELSVSPDGREFSVSVGDDFDSRRLWIVTADGQHSHPLNIEWPAKANQDDGHWTPDGKHFVFSSSYEDRSNLYEIAAPPWYAFWRKPTAQRITGNQLPVVSAAAMRDSQGFFVLGRTDEGAMRAFDPQSRKMLPYLDDLSMMTFVVSPDRQWMVYSEYPSRHLWKSRIDGSEKLQLTDTYGIMQQWSPDGKWIAYSDWKNVYLISASGGVPQKLTPDSAVGVAPTWLRDGRSIAFNNFPTPGTHYGIHVIDLATRQISDMPGGGGFFVPSWSPDGKYMVAIAQNPSRMVLYTAATRQWSVLRAFDKPWGYWVWAADSRSIFMGQIQGDNGMFQLTVPQGGWIRLAGLGAVNDPSPRDSFLSLTPEGQPAMMSRTGVGQIYSLRWPL